MINLKQKHTYDMGIIGNCSYLALIDSKAAVRWMCWPRFDSSFIFGNILDDEKGGDFSIECYDKDVVTNQYYAKNTNILITDFQSEFGKFRVTDYAPRFEQSERMYKPLMLFRKIEVLEGASRIKITCNPRGKYGELIPTVQQGSNHLRYEGFSKPVRLTTNIPVSYILENQSFILSSTKYMVFSYGLPVEGGIETVSEDFLRKTTKYWQDWVKNCTIEHIYQEAVIRSSLCLKVHEYEDTGAIIASATMGLPEHHLSGRNWDYRYCWMRDSFYTLQALNQIGHFNEVREYANYIENIIPNENDRYNPVYTILGRKDFEEVLLDLKGYKKNQPVRLGNQAKEHIQNDVYGQILVALLPGYVDERYVYNEKRIIKNSRLIMRLLNAIDKTMDEPDAGLWEFRNKSQKHCYTFLFHWAGAKAAAKIARVIGDEKMKKYAEKLAGDASVQIELCYSPTSGAYMQAIGVNNMDASLLQLITMKYLDPKTPRAKKHLKALEDSLMTPEGLLFRYKHHDDFGAPENTFLVCTFWYIEALACVGRVNDAKRQLDKVLGYANHLGLFAEDVHAPTGSQWGNFPQTYSHVGLMNSVSRLARMIDEPSFL